MNVAATGMPVLALKLRSAGAAPTRATPLPASTIGRSAPLISSAASSISPLDGSGRRKPARTGNGSASSSASITSSGSSR